MAQEKGITSKLLYQLNEFRKNEKFIDIRLLSSDGILFSAHRNILAATSPYFLAMFSGNFPEVNSSEIKLPEINSYFLQLAMEFIYTGLCGITNDNVQQLSETASFLQLCGLAAMCNEYMIKLLDPENCLGFKNYAEKQNNQYLFEVTIDFIKSNFREVVQYEEFFEMSYEELVSILSNNEFFLYDDDTILKGIVRWAEYKPDIRLDYLPKLVRFLQPICITAENAHSIKTLTEHAGCQQWLREVELYEGSLEWRIFLVDKMGLNFESFRYDIHTNTMVSLNPPPGEAFAISLTAHKNIIYMQGGRTSVDRRNSYYYNIYRNQWYELTPLVIERSDHRSLILNDCLFAFGGRSTGGITNTVEYLNLATNKSKFCRPMQAQRCSMGAVLHDDIFYVMGGDENGDKELNSLERFDPRANIWQTLSPMNEITGSCTSAVIDQYIYCCKDMGLFMERYDIRANRWELIDFEEISDSFELCAVDNQLFRTSNSSITRYDMEQNRWINVHQFAFRRIWDCIVAMPMVTLNI